MKLIDFYRWDGPKSENIRGDVFDLIKIFYDSVGGRRLYRRDPTQRVRRLVLGHEQRIVESWQMVPTGPARLELRDRRSGLR